LLSLRLFLAMQSALLGTKPIARAIVLLRHLFPMDSTAVSYLRVTTPLGVGAHCCCGWWCAQAELWISVTPSALPHEVGTRLC
jgi:hypothetical protein